MGNFLFWYNLHKFRLTTNRKIVSIIAIKGRRDKMTKDITKIQLIPMQKELLKAEYARNLEKVQKMREENALHPEDQGAKGFSTELASTDTTTSEIIKNLNCRNAEIKRLLDYAPTVTRYSENEIAIGTKFVATIDFGEDDQETEEYLLIHTKVSNESLHNGNTITTESPIGRAVMGLKVGDEFTYLAGEKPPIIMKGTIDSIYSKKEIKEGRDVPYVKKRQD